jgi:hypothetical protein
LCDEAAFWQKWAKLPPKRIENQTFVAFQHQYRQLRSGISEQAWKVAPDRIIELIGCPAQVFHDLIVRA